MQSSATSACLGHDRVVFTTNEGDAKNDAGVQKSESHA